MPRKILTIPKAPLARLMQNAGAARVGEDACEEMSDFLKEYAIGIAKKAAEIAKHSGRKTVNAGDVKIGSK